jgi:hypothetical protein
MSSSDICNVLGGGGGGGGLDDDDGGGDDESIPFSLNSRMTDIH